MKLVDQHTKKIMEGCKERAADAGLKFDKETLEYIVTNSDMIELTPKNMIPTLYDYWIQDIQVIRGKGEYEFYPSNPYETVINTRPVISYYNDNNPDWLNVMIFYHVIAHIDFFQNNKFFEHTWKYDFKEKALTDKRIIARLRTNKKRQVDYLIEFARGIDNLVGYYDSYKNEEDGIPFKFSDKIDYYFNVFLQKTKKIPMSEFLEEVENYNAISGMNDDEKDEYYLNQVRIKYPEFDNMFQAHLNKKPQTSTDLLQFILENSEFLNDENNKWMKVIVEIVRDTSLYFSPMIRTKTMNEGWASYWHEKLFLKDERIKGHEVSFAKINAMVTSVSRVGLNPYAIGWRLFMFIEEAANKGKLSYDFEKINNIENRRNYDSKKMNGHNFIFHVRENYCDFTFFNRFVNQEFIDNYNLLVVGSRINPQRNTREYYVKSKKVQDYKKMLFENLYHPPFITFDVKDKTLILKHQFEGQELYKEYIPNTLIGIEYLWGNPVHLETTEIEFDGNIYEQENKTNQKEPMFNRVLYKMENRKLIKEYL